MRILVTGGAGFIGTNLIKRLVLQGHEVTSYDNYTTGKKENHIKGCDYYDVDITTCTFEVDFDIVFHMAAIARFYNVYGPYQLTEGGYTTLIGRWLKNIEKGLPCEIYGDGSKRRDFTHVDDIIEALIRIVDREKYGYIFELGRGKNITVNAVANMLNIKPIYKADKPGEAFATLADRTEARLHLEWDAKINLEDYLKTI